MGKARWVSKSVNVGATVFCGQCRGHGVFGDVPEALGGHDTALIPPEGLLVTLGNCLGMEVALACRNKGVPYAGMTVEVEAQWDEEEHFLSDFRMKVRMPEEVEERTRRTVMAGVKMCTVRNTLQRGAEVELEIEESSGG